MSARPPGKHEPRYKPILDHVFWNGLGFNLLGDTTVILLALHLGADNFQLGLLGAILPLSGLVLWFYPWLYSGRNPVRLFRIAWSLRGWVCLGYLLLPLLPPRWGVWWILVIFTVFGIVRMVGAVLFPLFQRGMADEDEQPALLSRQSMRFHSSAALSRVLASLLLSVPGMSGLAGLMSLLGLGFIANRFSILPIRHFPDMPPTDAPRERNLLRLAARSLADVKTRVPLLLHWSLTLVMVFFAFTVAVLGKVAGRSKAEVFTFALLSGAGAVAWSGMAEKFLEGSRVRSLALFGSILTALLCAGWAFVPKGLAAHVFFAVAPLQGMLLTLLFNAENRIYLSTLPERDGAAYSAMSTFGSAVIALGAGLLGGTLADAGRLATIPGMNEYGYVFLVAGLFSLMSGVLALRSPAWTES